MKKTLLVSSLSLLLFSITSMAQNWVTSGNALSANGTLGSTTNFSVVFKSNNSERGRLTNSGLWGFGTTAPNAKLHINSASGQSALRAQVNASTKFLVHSGGGVSIGSGTTPPANGLYVAGRTGIGTSAPEATLHIFKGSAGSVTAYPLAPLVVENSTACYINLLAPDNTETGILFGKPANNISGGIIYSHFVLPSGLEFRTGGNNIRMVIDSNGNVAVGTLSTDYRLKVSHGLGGLDIENNSTSANWELYTSGSASGDLYFFTKGSLVGSFNASTGAYTALSDERLKTNIHPMNNVLSKIKELKPSTYQFKNTTDKQEYNGFIAQDVMKIFPSLVMHNVETERKLDVYTLDYSGFGVIAIKGIQELQPVIQKQEEKITTLEDEYKLKIATLEDRIAKLEAALASVTANNNGVLEQNKPNPFNKSTIIRYSIPQGSKGQINIYDQAGKLVKALKANENSRSELSSSDLAAGTYTYTLMIDNKTALSKQMLIIK